MCSDNKRAAGIQFTSSKSIVMKSLTIANCVFDAYIDTWLYSNCFVWNRAIWFV